MPDDYDALADLFLGEAPSGRVRPGPPSERGVPEGQDRDRGVIARLGAEPAPAIPARRPVMVEGIVLGHLPVTGAAWANQYARHIADTTGEPVAVLKMIAGQASVELVGAGPEPLDPAETAPGDVAQAVAVAARHVHRWLVRVDEPSEPLLLEPGRLDALTLLTGVDEAAVVASYQTLKGLMERNRGEDRPPGPRFGLALMGASEDRAAARSARIVRAAEMFLGQRITVEACVGKIGPGGGAPAVALFRGPVAEEERERTLASLREWASAAVSDRAPASVQAAAAPEDGAAPTDSTDRPARRVAPESDPERGRPASDPASIGDLAGLLGMTPLRAACPYAGAVELGVDADGGLHLLVGASAAGQRGWCRTAAEAVEQLLAASSWAVDHLPLLRMSEPGAGRVSRIQRPVLHLVVDDARAARRLLDGDVRVHLVVRVGDRWGCAGLN